MGAFSKRREKWQYIKVKLSESDVQNFAENAQLSNKYTLPCEGQIKIVIINAIIIYSYNNYYNFIFKNK